jgi:hypothetical protein
MNRFRASVLRQFAKRAANNPVGDLLARLGFSSQDMAQHNRITDIEKAVRSLGIDPSNIPADAIRGAQTPEEAFQALKPYLPTPTAPPPPSWLPSIAGAAGVGAGGFDLARYIAGLRESARNQVPLDPALLRHTINTILADPSKYPHISPSEQEVFRNLRGLSDTDLRRLLNTLHAGAQEVRIRPQPIRIHRDVIRDLMDRHNVDLTQPRSIRTAILSELRSRGGVPHEDLRTALNRMLVMSHSELQNLLGGAQPGEVMEFYGSPLSITRDRLARILNERSRWRPGALVGLGRQQIPSAVEVQTRADNTAQLLNAAREAWWRRLLRGPLTPSGLPLREAKALSRGARRLGYGLAALTALSPWWYSYLFGGRNAAAVEDKLRKQLDAIYGKNNP